MTLSTQDQLQYLTARVSAIKSGQRHYGSAFFFRFADDGKTHIPALITNKHVIDGAEAGTIVFHTINSESGVRPSSKREVNIANFQDVWLRHPDDNIDLAALPIAGYMNSLEESGENVFFRPLGPSLIPDQSYLDQLNAIEDVVMVGYPNGIWDEANNLPITRRGLTATAPYVDFNNEPLFLIDCACWPGSSGSPVLLYNMGGYVDKKGGTRLGANRIMLLGVLYAGPIYMANGNIMPGPLPTNASMISQTPVMVNLGFCVKSKEILFFEEVFKDISSRIGTPPLSA